MDDKVIVMCKRRLKINITALRTIALTVGKALTPEIADHVPNDHWVKVFVGLDNDVQDIYVAQYREAMKARRKANAALFHQRRWQ